MFIRSRSFFVLFVVTALSSQVLAQGTQRLQIEGLDATVEILKDRWGISHIYAETEHDLFFAQGYSAARDRLFQFEIWRAQATGTTAEILGPRAIDRDHGMRLFKYRGPMAEEMNHYHPRGVDIIGAFVHGVNAYIDEALENPEDLPLPFKLLGIEPKHWSEEVVISRHQGLLGNIGLELRTGRAVCEIGAEAVKELQYYHPHEPDLSLDPMIDCESLIENDILHLYNAYRATLRFEPEDIALADSRNDAAAFQQLAATLNSEQADLQKHDLDI